MTRKRKALTVLGSLLAVALATAGWLWYHSISALNSGKEQLARDIADLRARLTTIRDRLRGQESHRRALEYIRSGGTLDPGGDLNWLQQFIPDLEQAQGVLKDWLDSGRFSDFEAGDSKKPDVTLNWAAVESISPERMLIAAGICTEFELGAGTVQMAERRQDWDAMGSWIKSLEEGSYTREDLEVMAAGLDRLRETRVRMLDRLSADLCRVAAGWVESVGDPGRTLNREPGWKDLKSRTLMVAGLLKDFEWAQSTLKRLEAKPVWERTHSPDLKTLSERLPMVIQLAGLRYWIEEFEETFDLMAQLGTSIARYRADKGAYPPTLEALVPRYLSAVPGCPSDEGRPFGYENGTLKVTFMGQSQPWKVLPGVD